MKLNHLILAACAAALTAVVGIAAAGARGPVRGGRAGAGGGVHAARRHRRGHPGGHPRGLVGAAADHHPRVARRRRPAGVRRHRQPGQPLLHRSAGPDRHVDVQPADGGAPVPGQLLPALRVRRQPGPAARRARHPDRRPRAEQPVRVVRARGAGPQRGARGGDHRAAPVGHAAGRRRRVAGAERAGTHHHPGRPRADPGAEAERRRRSKRRSGSSATRV